MVHSAFEADHGKLEEPGLPLIFQEFTGLLRAFITEVFNLSPLISVT